MKRPDGSKTRGERRSNDRDKIRKVGRIMTDDPRKVYSCIILDLSPSGALLLVHDKVPDQFELFHAAKRTLRSAVVVRRQRDTLGVRFEGESTVLPPGDGRLSDLRA